MRKYGGLMAMLAAGFVGLTCMGPTPAADEKKKVGDVVNAVNEQIAKDLATAAAMAEAGTKNQAPEMLLAAAALLLKAQAYTGGSLKEAVTESFEVGKVTNEDKGDVVIEKGAKEPAAEKAKSFKEQADDLFETATSMTATGPKDYAAAIKAIKARNYSKTKEYAEYKKDEAELDKTAARGAVGGPKRISRRIQAGGCHRFTIRFQGGQPAGIAIQSNAPVRFKVHTSGRGDLANSIVTTFRYTWMPRATHPVTVEVHGMGRTAQYTVITN